MGMERNSIVVNGQPASYQSARTLLGWLRQEEAIRLLLGREPDEGEDVAAFEKMYMQRKDAIISRPPPQFATSIVAAPSFTWDLAGRAKDPALHSAMAGLNWSLQVVDLRRVLAYQKTIRLDGFKELVDHMRKDRGQLLEFCLPTEQEAPPRNLSRDTDQKGFTISSPSPNLRIAANEVKAMKIEGEAGMPPTPVLAVTFYLSMGASYMKVANFNGRDFLREGYHRAAALLRAGIYEVPCVYIAARTYEELGADRERMFHSDTLFGPRPPLLSDFWDDTVSATINQRASRKAVRVTAEEFAVEW